MKVFQYNQTPYINNLNLLFIYLEFILASKQKLIFPQHV